MFKDLTMSIDMQELARFARERSSFYAFLNLHFMILPDENFIQQMRHSNLVDEFAALEVDPGVHPELADGWTKFRCFLDDMKNTPVGEVAQILGVDRTRLYRGASAKYGPPPPYEAVWVNDGRDVEKVLDKLMTLFLESGFAPSEEYKERVDYIGTEIDYLRQMTLMEAESWEKSDALAAMDTVHKESLFVKSISEWVSHFAAEAMKFAQTDFYRGHIQMVKGFLADEAERLDVLMNEIRCSSGSSQSESV